MKVLSFFCLVAIFAHVSATGPSFSLGGPAPAPPPGGPAPPPGGPAPAPPPGGPPPTYPCGVVYRQYNLNNEPANWGLSAGEYSPGNQAYVGLGAWQSMNLNAGRLQLSPPGLLVAFNGGSNFLNSAGSIWFVEPKPTQTFTWVASQNGDTVADAVDFDTYSSGTSYYFGRIKTNTTVYIGIVPICMGRIFYADENGKSLYASEGYEVLTCTSTVADPPTTPPQIASTIPNVDTGCINNWVRYNGDNEPVTKGVSAGEHSCGSDAYVGKGSYGGPWRPGRIQTTGAAGFYVLHKAAESYVQNDSYYLADNPSYTYTWKTFEGSVPDNAVKVRNSRGELALAVTRLRVNGEARIGMNLGKEAEFPTLGGTSSQFFDYYDVLTCDPIPKYKCGAQTWKKYNLDSAPATDGFKFGTFKGSDSYIGRGTRQCIHDCSQRVGRIQIAPSTAAGVYYFDDLTPNDVFDTTTPEYLVKNPNNTYIWKASSDGARVRNAVEYSSNGRQPFYIGITEVDGNTFIGKVRPGKGLYFINADGKKKVVGSYAVLTCFSADPTNGV